jgi:hypothetical protein
MHLMRLNAPFVVWNSTEFELEAAAAIVSLARSISEVTSPTRCQIADAEPSVARVRGVDVGAVTRSKTDMREDHHRCIDLILFIDHSYWAQGDVNE